MAYTELLNVNEPDIDALKRFTQKLRFYNGTTDRWCPLSYADHLKEKVPDLYVEKCQKNIAHAFVLRSASDMAAIVAGWYEKDSS